MKQNQPIAFTFLASLVILWACPSSSEPNNGAVDVAAHQVDGQLAMTNPHGAAQSDPRTNTMTGRVLETMDGGGYTYARLKTEDGEVWVAGPKVDIEVDAVVTGVAPSEMRDFYARSMERTFEVIFFLSGWGEASQEAPSGGSAINTAEKAEIQVEKAADGYTVSELFAQKEKLAGKSVAVRGKVVKYNEGIMGSNWIHLQDGSGSSQSGDHDLVVTTQHVAAVGELVLVRGNLAIDKDFGAGYRYAVIIESAEIQK